MEFKIDKAFRLLQRMMMRFFLICDLFLNPRNHMGPTHESGFSEF